MIKLTKAPEPAILAANGTKWLTELKAVLAKGEEPTATQKRRYAHEDIKAAVVAETNAKCAYCESKIRHVAPGDIEHIVPKSKEVDLSFVWSNLTLACTECNRRKLDFVQADGLVDPYSDEPEDHLMFIGETIYPHPQSERGILTEDKLELNRPELWERRKERLKYLVSLAAAVGKARGSLVRAILLAKLDEEVSGDRQFAAMSRTAVAQLKLALEKQPKVPK